MFACDRVTEELQTSDAFILLSLNVCLNQFHLSNCCETGKTASGVMFYIFSQCIIILVAGNENLNRLIEVKKIYTEFVVLWIYS